MKIGKEIFKIHLTKVKTLFEQAKGQENAELWLFTNDLRTPMFMLQAASRVFEKVYDSTELEGLKEQFKHIEDTLGGIDHYNAALKTFSVNPQISAQYIAYFQSKVEQKTTELNEILTQNGWLAGTKLIEIESMLDNVDWKKEEKELKGIRKVYEKAIEKNIEFVEELNFKFTNLEEHVHELRRKLRWLSIYPQALQGVLQFQESTEIPPDYLSKYLTDSVINSPFNILPKTILLEEPIFLNKNHYLALSWTIAELGKLKDAGLQIEILIEAIIKTEKLTEHEAESKAHDLIGKPDLSIETVKMKAQEIAKAFFDEGNLERILI
jgi:hypothetical protein